MDSESNPQEARPRARGRARGRARSIPTDRQPPPEAVEEPGPQIFVGQQQRLSDGSSGGENGSGSKGNGSNGNSSGGSNSPNENSRGGSPRGMRPRPPETEEARGRVFDFVLTRPTPDFVKKGTIQHRKLPAPRIVANYFSFQKHPLFQMKLYSVRLEPQEDDARTVKRLVSQHKQHIGCFMLTGLMLFVTKEIPDEMLVFQATRQMKDQPEQSYNVTLEYVRDVRPSEPVVFQFFNTVVRQIQYMMEFTLLGRHFFNPAASQAFPNWRLELWPGFQNSIRQQEAGLMMNVEGVWKVLQTSNILRLMVEIRQNDPEHYQQRCTDAFCNTMVITRYGGNAKSRAYKITRIDFTASANSTFETREGPVTYVDYYRRKYNLEIRVPAQPMLVSEPRERDIRRGQVGDIYLVPELCYPCGLNEELRGNFRLMKDLAVCLHQPPGERVVQMQAFINNIGRSLEITQTLREWGIRVNPQPVEFNARYLNPEEIIMGENRRVTPDDKGDWSNSFRSQRMLKSASLKVWAIVVCHRNRQQIGNLVTTMKRVAVPLGYQISDPQIFPANDVRGFPQVIDTIVGQRKGKLDLIFAVLPNNNLDNYAAVKKRCSVDYGIPSQCFLAKNLESKGMMSICTKMVIQMNAKQGGEPWGVANPLKNVMVLGYDVHHAGAGGGRSVGAMCATINVTLGGYYSCVRQTPVEREEVGTFVATMFESCLDAYRVKNNSFPDRIFMYRDGVGEGQLSDVLEMEVEAFKKRIEAKYGSQPHPKLTYVVVNKRISTRFFQKLPNGHFQNPVPGLIVDDVVTRPERYDFFLVSQTARQGCVSPTYYNVMLDENGLPPDRLQMFTFKMCHLYYNWSGTVSVPAPCQNAHKLAFQVGTALKRPVHDNLSYLLHFL